MLSVLLIADDLTGALDSVVPFCVAGRSVAVAVDQAGIMEACAMQPDILAINSDTRGVDVSDAVARIQSIWDAVGDAAPQLVIKKIDSRLNGHPAAEMHALLAASGRTQAWVCPAVPDMGRIVSGGQLMGAGVAAPVRLADHFPLSKSCRLVDATNADALQRLAELLQLHASTAMAVGARGLSQALAAMTPIATASHAGPTAVRLPLIMAIGSRDPATDRQISHLQEAGAPVAEIAAPDGAVPPDLPRNTPILLVRATDGGGGQSAQDVAARFAQGIAALTRQRRPGSLFASGGATAMAIARALDIHMLVPVGEVMPAVPISRVAGWDDMMFITKSGGFGEADALSKLIASVHATPSSTGLIPA